MTNTSEKLPRRGPHSDWFVAVLQWTGFQSLRVLLHLLSVTILRVNHFYGSCAGYCLWWWETHVTRVSRANLEIAYPTLSTAEREKLLKESLIEFGKTMTELGHLWMGSERRIRRPARG